MHEPQDLEWQEVARNRLAFEELFLLQLKLLLQREILRWASLAGFALLLLRPAILPWLDPQGVTSIAMALQLDPFVSAFARVRCSWSRLWLTMLQASTMSGSQVCVFCVEDALHDRLSDDFVKPHHFCATFE